MKVSSSLSSFVVLLFPSLSSEGFFCSGLFLTCLFWLVFFSFFFFFFFSDHYFWHLGQRAGPFTTNFAGEVIEVFPPRSPDPPFVEEIPLVSSLPCSFFFFFFFCSHLFPLVLFYSDLCCWYTGNISFANLRDGSATRTALNPHTSVLCLRTFWVKRHMPRAWRSPRRSLSRPFANTLRLTQHSQDPRKLMRPVAWRTLTLSTRQRPSWFSPTPRTSPSFGPASVPSTTYTCADPQCPSIGDLLFSCCFCLFFHWGTECCLCCYFGGKAGSLFWQSRSLSPLLAALVWNLCWVTPTSQPLVLPSKSCLWWM